MGYMRSGNYDIALEKLKKALEHDDSLPEVHNALGVLYEDTDKSRLARAHYSRAVRLNPRYSVARVNYGRYLCANGEPRKGEQQYLAAANDPEYPAPARAYAGAAICALEVPDPELAEVYLGKVLALRPDANQALYRLADRSYALGNYRQARGYLQRYHSRARQTPESLWLAISIENALGNRQQSRAYARMLAAKFGNSEQARRLGNL